jgi:GTPase SAR1 family protein
MLSSLVASFMFVVQGKTTFCNGMQQYLRLLGRNAVVVNLDPANDSLPIDAAYDVCHEAVSLQAVCEETQLGPNGGLMYCMEYIECHLEEIAKAIQDQMQDDSYLLLDFPGQVELYTHSPCARNILHGLAEFLNLRLTMVQLIDFQYCMDASKFISAALLGTTTLLRLELPSVNVLSKADLLVQQAQTGQGDEEGNLFFLPMQVEFFTECQDLDRLLPFLDTANLPDDDADTWDALADDEEYQQARKRHTQSAFGRKYTKLHESLAEVVQDFGLLSFLPLDISSAESVGRVLAKIDQANGYVFTQQQATPNSPNATLFNCAVGQGESTLESLSDIQERIGAPERIRELQGRV